MVSNVITDCCLDIFYETNARRKKVERLSMCHPLAARLGSAGEYVDYAASKGAVDTFTRGLAQEVAEEGIRVNAVRPGVIDTDIHASGGEPGRVERVKASIPMKRGGSAEEVAKAIMWLLSSESSYTTGSLLEVSGGR